MWISADRIVDILFSSEFIYKYLKNWHILKLSEKNWAVVQLDYEQTLFCSEIHGHEGLTARSLFPRLFPSTLEQKKDCSQSIVHLEYIKSHVRFPIISYKY